MKFRNFQLSIGALCLSCGAAIAADLDVPVEQYYAPSPYYISLHGGVTIPDDTDIEFEFQGQSQVPGVAHNDEGFRVGGALGYHFSEMLSGEVEVSYANADVSSIYAGGIFDTTVPTNGDGSLLTIMGNVIIGQNMGNWRPYIGAGVGAAHLTVDLDFGSGIDDSDWTWAVQGIAGIDISLSEQMSLGARYRYQHIGETDFMDNFPEPVALDATASHNVEAVLTVNFGN